jgi:transglutaminase-like putative cysteine protease
MTDTAAPTRPAESATDRLRNAQLPASLCLTALSVITVVALCRVFPDWVYLRSMLVVTIGTHLVAALLRFWRVPAVVAIPLLLAAIAELLALVYYRDTLVGPFPGSRTLELIQIDLRLVIEQFPTAVAPVPSEGSYAVVTAGLIAVCALLADTFAFRALGRLEAVVPTAVVFIFTAALGTDRHRVTVAAAWVAVALLTVAVLRFRHTSEEAAWVGARRLHLVAALPAIVATFALTAVVAAAVAPRLPGAGEKALIDTRNREGSVTEVLSPLVDIGAELRNRGNLELFTVRSSDGPHYWRAIGVPEFDGGLWQPAEEDLTQLPQIVDSAAPLTVQDITIVKMGGPLVPGAFTPVAVQPAQVFWAPGTQTLVLPDQSLQEGDQVRVISVVPRPSDAQLRAATVQNHPAGSLDLPSGVPQSARDLAQQVTAAAVTPFDKAVALQNWFRTNFTYDLNVQLGNSNDAIDAFLRERRGFCQQFAGTFAVMARSIGLPARVAVGYTPGELGADGLYHVYGRHAHSWAEVWFDGIGWVPFEPTPGRGSPDAVGYSGVEPQQAVGGGGNTGTPQTTPTTLAPVQVVDPDASTTVPGSGGVPGATTTTVAAVGSGGGSSGPGRTGLLVFALIALFVGWVVFAPRAIRAMAHRHLRSNGDRVVAAWQRTLGSLSLVGAPQVGGATPLEYAAATERTTGLDHDALQELALHVTHAVYAPQEVPAQVAKRCETLCAEVDAVCRSRAPLSARLRALVDPRLMRRRFAG